MKRIAVTLLLGCSCLCAIPSYAATVRVDIALNLNSGTIQDLSVFGQPPTQGWFAGGLTIAPVSLAPGDTLEIDVRLADGQALEMTSGAWGRQRLWLTIPGALECMACSLDTTLTHIALVDGQVDVPVTTQNSFIQLGDGGGLLANVDSPLTDTTIALTGFTLLTVYSPTTIVPDFNEVRVMFQADQLAIRPVPLPAAGWLMSMALGSLVARRLASRKRSTCQGGSAR